MIDGALCFFPLSLVKEVKQQHNTKNLCGIMSEEDFYRDLTKELGGGRKIGLDNYNYNYLYFFSSSSSFSSNADFKSLKLTVADPLSFAFCCVSEGDHPVMYRI